MGKWTKRCYGGTNGHVACEKDFGAGAVYLGNEKSGGCGWDARYECDPPGGGGSAKQRSKMSIENDKLVVNESTYEMLNSNTNKYLAKTVTNLASSCSGSANAEQEMNFSGNTVGGDANIGVKQSMDAQLNFSCVNASEVNREVGNDLANRLKGMIQDTTDTSVLSQMAAKAQVDQATTGGTQPPPKTTQDTDVTIKNKEEIRNVLNAKMTNIVDNEFKSENITNDTKECVAAGKASQKAIFQDNVFEGNLNLNVEQELSLKVVADCANKNNMGEKVTQKVLNDTFGGFETKKSIKSETKMEGSLTASQTATGTNPMALGAGGSIYCCFCLCLSAMPMIGLVLM